MVGEWQCREYFLYISHIFFERPRGVYPGLRVCGGGVFSHWFGTTPNGGKGTEEDGLDGCEG